MSAFSDRIKWLRDKQGYTQKEVADKLGLSQAGYGKIENGQREPNLEALSKMPEIFGESLDFICNVTDIDNKLMELYTKYFYERSIYERLQKRLDGIEDLLKNVDEDMIESRLNFLVVTKERLPLAKESSETAYTELIEYIKTIPHANEDNMKKETWDDLYKKYLDRVYKQQKD